MQDELEDVSVDDTLPPGMPAPGRDPAALHRAQQIAYLYDDPNDMLPSPASPSAPPAAPPQGWVEVDANGRDLPAQSPPPVTASGPPQGWVETNDQGHDITDSGVFSSATRSFGNAAVDTVGSAAKGVAAIQGIAANKMWGNRAGIYRGAQDVLDLIDSTPNLDEADLTQALEAHGINKDITTRMGTAMPGEGKSEVLRYLTARRSGDTATADSIRAAVRSEAAVADTITPVRERAAYQAGDTISDAADEYIPVTPEERDRWYNKYFANPLGSTVPFLLTGMAAAPAGVGVGLTTTAATGAATNAGASYDQAIEEGANDAQALEAAGYGAAGGLTEALPIFGHVGKRFLNPAEESIYEIWKRGGLREASKNLGKEVTLGAGEEAAQEASQNTISNYGIQQSYDPNRPLLDGIGDNAAGGAGAGGTLALLGAFLPGKARGARGGTGEPPTNQEPPPPSGAAPATETPPAAPQPQSNPPPAQSPPVLDSSGLPTVNLPQLSPEAAANYPFQESPGNENIPLMEQPTAAPAIPGAPDEATLQTELQQVLESDAPIGDIIDQTDFPDKLPDEQVIAVTESGEDSPIVGYAYLNPTTGAIRYPNEPHRPDVGRAWSDVPANSELPPGAQLVTDENGVSKARMTSSTAPVKVETADDLSAAAARAASSPKNSLPEPTQGQKEAGNYQKAHVNIQGLNISIETPEGGKRSGTGPDGKPWEVTMPVSYGYVKRTTGADDEQVDVFLGNNPDSKRVYVLDQVDPDTGKFDEHKAFIGFQNPAAAWSAYSQSFSDGKAAQRIGGNVTVMPIDDFKAWLKNGDTKSPVGTIIAREGVKEDAQVQQEKGRRRETRLLNSEGAPVPEKAPGAPMSAEIQVALERADYMPDIHRKSTGWKFLEHANSQGVTTGAISLVNPATGEMRKFTGQNGYARAQAWAMDNSIPDFTMPEPKVDNAPTPKTAEKPKRQPAPKKSTEPVGELVIQPLSQMSATNMSPAPTQQEITEEEYLSSNGAARHDIGDAGLHKTSTSISKKTWSKKVARQSNKDAELIERRDALRAEYRSKVAAGEIKPPSNDERLARTAQGHPDNAATQAAKRLLEKKAKKQETKKTPAQAKQETVDRFDQAIKDLIARNPEYTAWYEKAAAAREEGAAEIRAALVEAENKKAAGEKGPLDVRSAEAWMDMFNRGFANVLNIPGRGSRQGATDKVYQLGERTARNFLADNPKPEVGGENVKVSAVSATRGDTTKYELVPKPEVVSDIKKEVEKLPPKAFYSRPAEQEKKTEPQQPKKQMKSINAGVVAISADDMTAKEKKLAERVTKEIKRLMPAAEVRVHREMESTGFWGDPGEVYGFAGRAYTKDKLYSVIHWALAAEGKNPTGALGVGRHEVIHTLRQAGMFTSQEWAKLEKAARDGKWVEKYKIERNYSELTEEKQLEEAIAEHFAHWMADQNTFVPAHLRPLFARLKALFEAIARAAKEILGKDITAEDVMKMIASGEIGRRPAAKESEETAAFQRAYHGSPYQFDEFTLDHIGNGEGAQAYGWGLYFASEKKVAEFYKDKLEDYKIYVDGKQINLPEYGTKLTLKFLDQKIDKESINEFLAMLRSWREFGVAGQSLRDYVQNYEARLKFTPEEKKQMLSMIEPSGLENADLRKEGKLYEVELPEDSELLHYEQTIDEQPAPVKEALEKVRAQLEKSGWLEEYEDQLNADFSEWTGADIIKKVLPRAASDDAIPMDEEAIRTGHFKRAASEYLNSLGIKGVKYLDGNSRARGGSGKSHNFVIFDDKAIEMLKSMEEETAPAFARAPKTDSQAFKKWFGDSKVVDENGNPLIVYHGTGREFDTFKQKSSDIGFHFGTIDQANDRLSYMRGKREEAGQSIMPFYLSIQNPLILDSDPGLFDWNNLPYALRATGEFSEADLARLEEFENAAQEIEYNAENAGVDPDFSELEPDWRAEVGSVLQDNGYDGIKYLNSGEIAGMSDIMRKIDAAKTSEERSALYEEKKKLEATAKDYSWVVLESGQAKSIFNNGSFDRSNPNIMFARAKNSDEAPLTLAISDEGIRDVITNANYDLVDKIKAAAKGDTWRASMDHWRRYMQDRFLHFSRVQAKIEESTGHKIGEDMDVYGAEELFSGRAGAKLDALERKFKEPIIELVAAFNNKYGNGIQKIEDFLYAMHAPERNAQIAKINEKMPDGGSGMTNKEAAEIIEQAKKDGQHDELAAIAEKIHAMLDAAVEERLKMGLINKETADSWRKYKHYVPLRGTAEVGDNDGLGMRTGKGMDIRGKESKRAKGRKSKASDLLAHTFAIAEEAIIRGEKNKVDQALYNLVKTYPDKDLWEIAAPKMSPVLNQATGLIEYRAAPAPKNMQMNDFTVGAKVNGVQKLVTLKDKRLATPMKNLEVDAAHGLLKFMMMYNRFLSHMNTTMSPEFIIVNAFRDLQTASINLAQFDKKGLGNAVRRDYLKALKGAWGGLRGKENTEWQKYFQEYTAAGGKVNFFNLDDLNARRTRLKRELGLRAPGKLPMTKRAAKEIMDFIELSNQAVENAIRLSSFVNARRKGMTDAEAARLAKNLTVNFNKRGEFSSKLNAMYLFYNASVQSVFVMLNALKSRKVQAIVAGIVAMGFAEHFLNNMLSPPDDDDEPLYDKIPEYTKESNIIIMDPTGKLGELVDGIFPMGKIKGVNYVKIPMAYGYRSFHELGRASAAVASGKETATKAAANVAYSFINNFNPIGGEESILNFFAPTILDPLVDISQNKKFTGSRIYPAANQFDKSPPPDSERYFPNASEASKWVAKELNSITGGDKITPGLVDVSPGVLDYMFSQLTGAAGAFVGRMADTVGKGVIDGGELAISDVPFGRQVLGGQQPWFDKNTAYDRIHNIENLSAREEKYRDAKEYDKARDVRAENHGVLALEQAAKDVRKDLAGLRKKRVFYENHQVYTKEQKEQALKRLDEQEREIVVRFNRRYIKAAHEDADR